MEPTRECSLGSTTSVRLTPSAPGGHCSASPVPSSKTRMAHAAMVLRIIPFKPRWGSPGSMIVNATLAAGAAREAGDRLIGSADLDGVHSNQYLPCFRAEREHTPVRLGTASLRHVT